MASRKLTETFARSVRVERRTYFWDTHVAGFALRVAPTQRGFSRRWIVRYRTRRGGLQREFLVGPYPALDCARARERAREIIATVYAGGDPSQQRKEDRAAMTVERLCERFIDEHCASLRQKTRRTYASKIRCHVLHPTYGIGKHAVPDVRREHVQALVDGISNQVGKSGTRLVGQARLVRGVCSSLFEYAARIGAIADGKSPVRGVKVDTKRREWELDKLEPVGHVFELEEAKAVWEQLAVQPMCDSARDCLRLIALTGLRYDEARTLRWQHVELERRHPQLAIRRHKTSDRVPVKFVPLPRGALDLLDARGPASPHLYVFPSPRDSDKPVGSLWAPWRRVARAAGVPKARVHDLRGLAACTLKDAGWSLEQIQTFMGWASAEVAQRYVRASAGVLREGAQIIDLRLRASGNG